MKDELMLTATQEIVSTGCFFAAVVHTFLTGTFAKLAQKFPKGSLLENLLHYAAEVEVVFGLWAIVFLIFLGLDRGLDFSVQYMDQVNFSEAAFVTVIMAMASTKPVMLACEHLVLSTAKRAPKNWQVSLYFLLTLIVGPLLGSLITEPAAMVVCVLLLKPLLFDGNQTSFMRYSTLAVILVNISIGGTLTHFAAPPVIMVSKIWQWDLGFMLMNFGWKSAIIVTINALMLYAVNYRELKNIELPLPQKTRMPPIWLMVSHVGFIFLVVQYHSRMAFFIPLFLLFLGWTDVTREYQDGIKIREALLVGFFIGGLVLIGQSQAWWIKPLIGSLGHGQVFLGATALTAITDNAALTYLATLISHMDEETRYLIVAGAVSGGGLTVIANAPNPIALGLLKDNFPDGGISPVLLFKFALLPTIVACVVYWML